MCASNSYLPCSSNEKHLSENTKRIWGKYGWSWWDVTVFEVNFIDNRNSNTYGQFKGFINKKLKK